MKKRTEKLLLDVATQFENGQQPMHHEWLCENKVTLDECGALSDQLAAIIRGYIQSPQHVQIGILAASAMPDKQSGNVVSALWDQRRAQKRLETSTRR